MTESAFTLTPISMGARIYIPGIGRFTQVDPVEGGVENNYVYPVDPVNEFDLTGQWSVRNAFKKAARWTWKNRERIVGGLAFGVCVVASAGACFAAGAAAAAINAANAYAANRRQGAKKAAAKAGVSLLADATYGAATRKIKLVRQAGKVVLGGRKVALSWSGARRALSTKPGKVRFGNSLAAGVGGYYASKAVEWANRKW